MIVESSNYAYGGFSGCLVFTVIEYALGAKGRATSGWVAGRLSN